MNFSAVVFWDPKRVKTLNLAQPYLDYLRRIRILQDTPESAAKLDKEVYEEAMDWWISSEVQEVRKKFFHQFTRASVK
jgi:putative transferase (TIGR04331 family)